MGNVTTCEEYVINKLTALERENENLKANLHALSEDYHVLSVQMMKTKNYLKGQTKVRTLDSGSKSLSFDSFYDWDQKEELEFFMDFLELNETEEEDGNEESNS